MRLFHLTLKRLLLTAIRPNLFGVKGFDLIVSPHRYNLQQRKAFAIQNLKPSHPSSTAVLWFIIKCLNGWHFTPASCPPPEDF
jgi:hypothetical protein